MGSEMCIRDRVLVIDHAVAVLVAYTCRAVIPAGRDLVGTAVVKEVAVVVRQEELALARGRGASEHGLRADQEGRTGHRGGV